MLLFEYLFLIASVLLFVYYLGTFNYNYFSKRGVKFVKPFPFVGNYTDFFRGIHATEIGRKISHAFPSERYVGFFHFHIPTIWITDSELIKQVGVKDFESFMDHSHPLIDENDPLYSNMLVALRGQKWKQMRALLTPMFTSAKIKAMHPFVSECSEHTLDYVNMKINKAGRDMAEVNIKHLFTRYASDVIASVVFGLKVNTLVEEDSEFLKMGRNLSEFDIRFTLIFGLSSAFPKLSKFLGLSLIDKDSEKYFRDIIVNTIKTREDQGIRRNDMIDLLIDLKKGCLSEDESNGTIDENDIRFKVEDFQKTSWTDDELTAQALIFFLAGYETMSSVLTYTIYTLAINPNEQKRLIEEIDTVSKDGNLYENILKMTYMDMVVSECLRLYPSIYAVDRVCTKPYTLPPPNSDSKQNYQLNIGDRIMFQLRAIMRNPFNFTDPNKFDPERFSEENRRNIKPFTYLPFGVGPRQCIGKRLGMMEMKNVIFHIFSEFEVAAGPKTEDPSKQKTYPMSNMPIEGIWVAFKRRKTNNVDNIFK